MRLAPPEAYPLPATFFVGAWSPKWTPRLCAEGFLPGHRLTTLGGGGWGLLSGVLADSPDGVASTIHPIPEGSGGIAFRGHLADPAIATWSAPERILRAVQTLPVDSAPDGTFAAARASTDRLELRADPLGIGPLYYREIGEIVFFATHPGLLGAGGDELDLLAASDFLVHWVIGGDRSFRREIRRLPQGECLVWHAPSLIPSRVRSWDWGEVIRPTTRVTTAALDRVNAALEGALRAVLRLETRRLILPLSGGWDSRRLLAHLCDLGAAPELLSVQTLSGERSIDLEAASELARIVQLTHHGFPLARGLEFDVEDRLRQRLVGGETVEHTWALQMYRHLTGERQILVDGLAGDVLAETGYEVVGLHEPGRGRERLIQHLLANPSRRVLPAEVWPGAEERRADLEAWLGNYPEGENLPDLVFLARRTRRGTGLCFQNLTPGGTVAVTPYTALEHVRATLAVHPEDRLARSLQDRILASRWPTLWAIDSSRRPGPASPNRRHPHPEDRLVLDLDEWPSLRRFAATYLTREGRTKLALARRHPGLAARWSWWLRPFTTWWREVEAWSSGGIRLGEVLAGAKAVADPPIEVGEA